MTRRLSGPPCGPWMVTHDASGLLGAKGKAPWPCRRRSRTREGGKAQISAPPVSFSTMVRLRAAVSSEIALDKKTEGSIKGIEPAWHNERVKFKRSLKRNRAFQAILKR